MIQKAAIAVYNPSNPVESAFQEAFHRATGRQLTAEELKAVLRCLPTYRGLSGKVARNPRQVADILFGEVNTSPLWYYPCDIIELRSILSEKAVSWHSPILLFSPKAAKKLMPEYPVCLVLDKAVEPEGRKIGGVLVRESNRLHLQHSLKRVMIRDYLTELQTHQIHAIINETFGHVPTFLLTDMSGMAYEKMAATAAVPEAPMSNWYNRMKQAAGPADTFGKEFLIGKQPSIPDEDIQKLPYTSVGEALPFRPGDRVSFRYTDLKLPGWAKTKSIPLTRSLAQKPVLATVRRVTNDKIELLVDGSKEPQEVPIDNYVFFSKVE